MKKLNLLFIIFISIIVVINIATSAIPRIKTIIHNQKNIDAALKSGQIKQADTSWIIFSIPSVKSGKIPWKDAAISKWIANYCIDKCNDSLSSGYKFSGQIMNSNKSWSLKVTIKTDKEYAQPVKFDAADGKFIGNLYFDKSNRMETLIKIMLRDSDNIPIDSFKITLTE
jgi:hypothetical protein